MSVHLTRRGLLVGGALTLAGCAIGRKAVEPLTGQSPLPSPSPEPPPPAAPYAAPPDDPLPAMKTAAGRFVQALATFDISVGAPVAPPGYAGLPGLIRASAPLAAADRWSRGRIDVVQIGGLSPVSPGARSGVCLVVLRQELFAPDGSRRTVRRTADVRMRRRADGAWRVEELASVGGAPVPAGRAVSAAARSVLDNPRIVMPDTARWDILAGRIAVDLLVVLAQLADVAALDVSVLKSGHPRLVVDGRARPPVSSHYYGRAVDIGAIDGVPVRRAPRAQLRKVVDAIVAMPQVQQLGAPDGYDVDGRSRRVFSNLVHADHLHIAVGRPEDPGS